ncbi:hypothetical protein [Nitrobacter sp.]|jgi:hypothetical protein|uniref:hypothetical protein n=1 Tax=Nitrobacter sp. TaxID=29420 RepID=UPI003F6508DB
MDGQTKEQNRNSDIRDVEEHARLPARTVYEIVRQAFGGEKVRIVSDRVTDLVVSGRADVGICNVRES